MDFIVASLLAITTTLSSYGTESDDEELFQDFMNTKQDDESEKTKMEKPECKLIGEDGNVFCIIGRVRYALKDAGMNERAEEFTEKAFECQSYSEVLILLHNYVEVV